MNKQWTFWAALVLAIAFVLGIWIAGSTYLSVRKQRIVSVTGNAEQDFESDLIVWSASFRVQRATLSEEILLESSSTPSRSPLVMVTLCVRT